MPVAYVGAIFVSLVLVLSALRTRLVYELSGTSLLLLGTTRPGVVLYSLLVLPGTIIHELSHWIVAEILQVRTGQITILPDLGGEQGRERLGSVATQKSDPIRGFLIGIAPFISGLLILVVLGRLLMLGWGVYPAWQVLLIIYGVMVIGNSMMISREDRRTWPVVLILFALVWIFIAKFYPTLFIDHRTFFVDLLTPLNQVLGVTALFNLGMIAGSYTLRRVVEKATKKHIVQRKG